MPVRPVALGGRLRGVHADGRRRVAAGGGGEVATAKLRRGAAGPAMVAVAGAAAVLLSGCGGIAADSGRATSPPPFPQHVRAEVGAAAPTVATVLSGAPSTMSTARPVDVVLASPPRSSAVSTAPPIAPVTQPPAPPTAPRPLRRVVLGDSITFGTPPYLGGYGEFVPGAVVIGGSGQDPTNFPWEAELWATGASDFIVLQDYVADGQWYAVHGPSWEAAWRSLVAVAHRHARTVYILVGGPGAGFLSTMAGVHITMPAADHPDGVHYTAEGSRAIARMVARVAV